MYIHKYREVRTNKRRGDCLNFPLGLEFFMTLKQPMTKLVVASGESQWKLFKVPGHILAFFIHQRP